jgi:hypothetical protein
MQALLTIDELSSYLHKSVASIRSDVSRNPHALPPICRLPGTKRLLWRVEDVEMWLEKHVVVLDTMPPLVMTIAGRRGRPSKSEQVAKRRRSAK